MWHRISAVFALLLGCFGCDQPLPSITPGDDGGVAAYPDGRIEPPHPLADAPIDHRFEPAGSQPSDGWTSPNECVPDSDADYCAACWSWNDGGPWSLDRNETGDRFGAAVAGGDFNGDHYPDLAVGAPGEKLSETGEGVIYLYLGTERGYQPWRRLETQDLGLTAVADMGLGTALAAGDFDADGFDDLAIALNTAGPGTESLLGFAMGSLDGLGNYFTVSLSEVDPSGATNDIPLGHALAVGDFDGDDDDDLAISAPDYKLLGYSGAGVVFTILGGPSMAPGPRIDMDDGGYPVNKYANFGQSLATYPTGIGKPDRLVVGAPGNGEIYLFDYGAYNGPYTSSLGLEAFGLRLAVGDLDNDGYPDVVASGYGASVVEVVSTGATIWSNDPRGSRDFFPLAIADFDMDGLQDLVLVSVPESGGWDNYLYFAGGNGSLVPDIPKRIKTNSEPWDDLGRAGFVQDIDGDWSPDLVVGAPVQDASGAGRVYAFTDGSGGVDPWLGGQSQMVHQELALDGCDICAVHGWSDGTVCDGGLGNEICVASSCVTRGCGDGYRQLVADGAWARESCDDGNTLSTDACSATCASQVLVVASDDLTADSPSRLPPSAAGDGRDHVLFAYTHDSGETRQLLARTYSAAGVPEQELAAPLVVATLPGVGWDAQASVAGLASGGWVVAWTDPDLDGGASGIAYRIIAADGSLGPVYTANEDARGEQLEPRVAALSTGFIVVWTDAGGFDGPLGRSLIEARRFTDSGAPLEDEWPISDPEATSTQPALASRGDDFVVIWTETPDAEYGPPTLSARRFGAVEDAVPFALASNASEASVAALETGEYAAAWTSRVGDYRGNILTRVIDPVSADPLGPSVEQTVAADGTYSEMAPSVAPLAGVEYAVAYETRGHRRGLAWVHVGMSTLPPETSTLTPYLTGDLEGDVTLLRTSRGLWFAWSDAGDTTTDAYRSFLAFLLPVD